MKTIVETREEAGSKKRLFWEQIKKKVSQKKGKEPTKRKI